MVGPSIMLVFGLAMGAGFFWDIRGLATTMRRRLEERRFDGALYRKMPNWAFRAFGIWCFVFGIAQFVVFAVLES